MYTVITHFRNSEWILNQQMQSNRIDRSSYFFTTETEVLQKWGEEKSRSRNL